MRARSLALAIVLTTVACRTPIEDLGQLHRAPQPAFIPEGLEQVVVDAEGVRWKVVERRHFSSVDDSVDLWVQRADPDAPFGEPIFTGLCPSCYGRDRWVVTDPATGQREGACYLRRFAVVEQALRFEIRLGGDLVSVQSVPIAAVTTDTDGDGWSDATEQLFGTNPDDPDTDRDTLPDPRDPNPLAIDAAPDGTALPPLQQMVQEVLADTKACFAEKPLVIVGANRLRHAVAGLDCTALWHTTDAPPAQSLPTTAAGVDLAAREAHAGGLARIHLALDESNPSRPAIRVTHRVGTEVVTFAMDEGRYKLIDRRFEMESD